MTPNKEHEYRAEAERLAELPRDVQRQAVELIRAPADNPKVGKRDREEARERAYPPPDAALRAMRPARTVYHH